MEVFFVRHGQTDGNIARRHQHPNTPLNPLGRSQIQAVAAELGQKRVTHFITSTQLRAVESAEIIGEVIGLTPDTHPAFEELHRPLSLVGHRYTGAATLWYVARWFFNLPVNQGESYADFLTRVRTARGYLETLPKDARVVVVSHAIFINIFLEHLCLDTRMSFSHALKTFYRLFKLRNASIIHLHYVNRPNLCGWTILRR